MSSDPGTDTDALRRQLAELLDGVGAHMPFEEAVADFPDEGINLAAPNVDYTAWGWTHMIAGAIVAAAGVALFSGKMWARVIGVILASVSLLVNFACIAAYPFWSVIVIAMDIFLILALTVHGREMKDL